MYNISYFLKHMIYIPKWVFWKEIFSTTHSLSLLQFLYMICKHLEGKNERKNFIDIFNDSYENSILQIFSNCISSFNILVINDEVKNKWYHGMDFLEWRYHGMNFLLSWKEEVSTRVAFKISHYFASSLVVYRSWLM